VRPEPENEESYIGDGVYVSYDGRQFKLRAPRSSRDFSHGGNHVVYLERGRGGNLKQFLSYVKRRMTQ
jgi:hypothetical protein